MICSNCGTENLSGARFCMECATPFAAVCPSCGAANLPAAKFCSECATPMPGSPARAATATSQGSGPTAAADGAGTRPGVVHAERRLVSVLFADLVGFTAFSEGRDAEEVRDLQERYFTTVTETIGRYGGTIEKFIGDAVMALWGAPVAYEDDAERAVRAALDLIDAIRDLGPGLEIRAGIVTGEAAVTVGATNQGMVSGDMVNTASRLQSVAPPSTVLVGEATQRAAAGAVIFEAAGDQLLKGKVSPVPAWRAVRVVAQRGGVGRSETLEAPFVGREEELRQLKDHFHAATREGRPRLVSIMGPAGIGKSRLAWEFLKYIDGLIETVWWHDGRSPAYGDGITFWALGEMVRGRARLTEDADEPTTRAAIAAMLVEHVPDPEERAWIEPALLSLLGIEAETGAELFGAWRTFFERLAATNPVVMVFEDFHHADAGLIDFVDHILEWSRNVPVLILTLARPELIERRPDWGAGKRSFTSIHLEPLPVEAMRDLLAGLVPGLPIAAREAIVARADGVPLYAVETVRMLLAQGRLVLEDGVYRPADALANLAVPETLTALISARLDELDIDDRALVADAAVLGQSFTPAALSAVSGVDATTLEPRLRGLVRRELLVQQVDPRSPERGQFAFVQALIREVAYNTLAKKERKVRHLAAARYFEAMATDELAGALAGHYLAAQGYAADGSEADALAAQARIALRGAAERAAALGSHSQAIAFLERAIAISPDADDLADLHGRALASAMEGLVPEVAERHGLGRLEARRVLGDREAIAMATADYVEAIRFFTADTERRLEIMLPAWEEFSDLEDTPAGVKLMIQLAACYATKDDRAALDWLERLLPIAERLDLLDDTATALARLGAVLFRLERPRQATMLMIGAHELAVAHDLWDVDRMARTTMTFRDQFDDPVAGLALARDGLDIAGRRGSTAFAFLMVGNAFSCALRAGEWAWAAALLDEWLDNEITGGFYLELYVDRAVLRALSGHDPTDDLAAAAGMLPEMEGDTQYASNVGLGRAWQAFIAGDLAKAGQEAIAAGDTTNYFVPIAGPLGGRAALWAGDSAAASDAIERLDAPLARGQAVRLDRATLRAGLAALEGRRVDAAAGYREVLRGWRQLGCAFDEAMAALDLAILLAPTEREMPEAQDVVAAAQETLARLGATPLLARLEATIFLAGLGGAQHRHPDAIIEESPAARSVSESQPTPAA